MTSSVALTTNQRAVLRTLASAHAPMSAYDLLEILQSEGLRAPPQIYRALDKLRTLGLVHRIETLNAFIACDHPDDNKNHACAFLICTECRNVEETGHAQFAGQVAACAQEHKFTARASNIEILGMCETCDDA